MAEKKSRYGRKGNQPKGSGRRGKSQKQRRDFPIFQGRVQMTREGYAFVIVEGEEDDIFVRRDHTNGALNGDIVKVAVVREKTDNTRKEGVIISIEERSSKPFVGVLQTSGKNAWVIMESRNMPYDIAIPIDIDIDGSLQRVEKKLYNVKGLTEVVDGKDQELQARSGMKVAAIVDKWDYNEDIYWGHIVDVLGEPGENDTEMHAILAEYSLPYRFEAEVEKAADQISDEITPEEIATRKDFRDVLTFTIDPVDAKDFDDALSCRVLENGNYEVGVHIADVSYYVQPGTVVDEEARERGNSVYLVDRTVPMLPENLSNKLCSLRPKEDKLTFSAVFELTPRARLVSEWFGRTVIRSNYRFAYETAQQIIDAGKDAEKMDFYGGTDGNEATDAAMMGKGATVGCRIPDNCKEAVIILNGLAAKLRHKRFAAGAISFERPEMKVECDETGRPIRVYQRESKEANWLIEEFMLLANRRVAEYVAKGCMTITEREQADKRLKVKDKTFIYRVHDEPNMDKLDNLRKFIGNFGYSMGTTNTGKQISKELNTLFAQAKDTPEYNAIELLSLRTMAKARYTSDNIGHYGLSFKYYTHFTSPIRRYPDTMVHRLLSAYLEGKASANKEQIESICKYTSEREIVAAEAERASIKYKLVEFMQDKVGLEFEGHISGLTDWGMYVEIEPTKIEGMVALRDIRSDFFEFDEDKYRIVGRRTGIVYNLGDQVRVTVKKANLAQKYLDYELVETGDEKRDPSRRLDYDSNVAFSRGYDGAFDNVDDTKTGSNKAARKEKVRRAIKESKKAAARRSGKYDKTSKDRTSSKDLPGSKDSKGQTSAKDHTSSKDGKNPTGQKDMTSKKDDRRPRKDSKGLTSAKDRKDLTSTKDRTSSQDRTNSKDGKKPTGQKDRKGQTSAKDRKGPKSDKAHNKTKSTK